MQSVSWHQSPSLVLNPMSVLEIIIRYTHIHTSINFIPYSYPHFLSCKFIYSIISLTTYMLWSHLYIVFRVDMFSLSYLRRSKCKMKVMGLSTYYIFFIVGPHYLVLSFFGFFWVLSKWHCNFRNSLSIFNNWNYSFRSWLVDFVRYFLYVFFGWVYLSK